MHHRMLAVVAVAVAASLCAAAGASAKQTITMSGSTSVYPLAVKLAKAYNKQYPTRARFKILQGGSDIGINDVARGRVTIGNASRDPERADPSGLVFNRVARDGICVVTHPSNPIGSLSQAQIQDVFSGRLRSWSDVPGARVSGPINVITRTAASGTADAFQNIFMGPSQRIAANAPAKTSNGLVRQTVAADRNAIGFVSLDFLSGVHAVGYRGVTCTLRNAKSGQYRGVRSFWMVTRGRPKGAAARFLSWVRTSPQARRAISSDWIALR